MKQMVQRSSLFIACLFLLTACAQLGLQAPETFKEKLAAGYTAVTSVRQSAVTLLDAGKLSADDGKNIQAQADNARAGLDVAAKMANTDLSAADNRVTAIRTALTAIAAYLATKK